MKRDFDIRAIARAYDECETKEQIRELAATLDVSVEHLWNLRASGSIALKRDARSNGTDAKAKGEIGLGPSDAVEL